MSKNVFLFPGQGGQFIGQGKEWADKGLMDIFNMADDISGRPISKLCFEGPTEELSQTANLQPAILAVSLAALRLMRQKYEISFAAGHSLGEFGALCAAGVLDEETAMKLVVKRAIFMNETAENNPGSMMAVIGLGNDDILAICELARNEGIVVPANYNTPEQVVISGESRAVAAAGKYIKLKGGRAIALPVSGAFHSPMMQQAADKFSQELEKTNFKEPLCPVAPNCIGTLVSKASEIKEYLIKQITAPVYWTKTVDSLIEAGATNFIEAWPKLYLGTLTKKCLPKDSAVEISCCKE